MSGAALTSAMAEPITIVAAGFMPASSADIERAAAAFKAIERLAPVFGWPILVGAGGHIPTLSAVELAAFDAAARRFEAHPALAAPLNIGD